MKIDFKKRNVFMIDNQAWISYPCDVEIGEWVCIQRIESSEIFIAWQKLWSLICHFDERYSAKLNEFAKIAADEFHDPADWTREYKEKLWVPTSFFDKNKVLLVVETAEEDNARLH